MGIGSVMKGGAVESERTTLSRKTSWSKFGGRLSSGPMSSLAIPNDDDEEARAALPLPSPPSPLAPLPPVLVVRAMVGKAGDDDRLWLWLVMLVAVEGGAEGKEDE